MKFGFCAPNYGPGSAVQIIHRSTLQAESLGYDSVWLTDHILMPQKSGTPYERIFESITTLAYLSGITKRIRLGISSLVLPMRNPIVVAKQLSNLDVLSGGRVMLCVSSGWSEKEFSFLGSDFHERGTRLDESIKLLRALWNRAPSFEGKEAPQFFSDAFLDPKPIQESIQLWIGGLSDRSMQRAANLGDAWHPNAHPLEQFKTMVANFRSIPGAQEKDICVRIALNTTLVKTAFIDAHGKERIALCANKKENKELLSEFEKLGVSYVVIVPASLPFFAGELFENYDDKVIIESLAEFAEQMML